jgi:hypothetical protein
MPGIRPISAKYAESSFSNGYGGILIMIFKLTMLDYMINNVR